MRYIPDKGLYSAVMFALKMCPKLQSADDSKVKIAANYYHVNYSDVLTIVREELWDRAIDEAKKNKDEWLSIYSPRAPRLLDTGFGNDYVLICPQCGAHYAFNVNSGRLNRFYVSQCKCGFTDKCQREIVRKDVYKAMQKED